jgi:hypothetical protein
MYGTGKVSRADFVNLLKQNKYIQPLRGQPAFDQFVQEF